jgi:predicted alpha/beta-fold hydrolase
VEAQAIFDGIKARVPATTPIYVVGVSVGGSVLINWLGRLGRNAASLVKGAAAVSVPHDLMAAGTSIDKGFNRVYVHNFLTTAQAQEPRDGGALSRPHRPGESKAVRTPSTHSTPAVTAVLARSSRIPAD